jgi:hypothetical protein
LYSLIIASVWQTSLVIYLLFTTPQKKLWNTPISRITPRKLACSDHSVSVDRIIRTMYIPGSGVRSKTGCDNADHYPMVEFPVQILSNPIMGFRVCRPPTAKWTGLCWTRPFHYSSDLLVRIKCQHLTIWPEDN